MKKNNLEKAIDDIYEELSEKENIIRYYKKDHHSNQIVGGYFFLEKNKEMDFLKKTHEFFLPINFHKKYDKPLAKLDEIGVIAEYFPIYGIEIFDKTNENLKEICKKVSEKYNLKLIE